MKTFCQILLIIIGLMTTHSSVSAQESVERSLDNFEKLRITGKIDAKLVPGEENKISLESEDDLDLSKISTEIKKGKLTVKLKSSLFKSHSAVARITYTSLKSIEALADANIDFAEPLKQDTLNLEASSGAKITLESETKMLTIKNFQGGQTLIKGKTSKLNAFVNTGGILSATDLECEEANMRLNTAGKAEITVKKKLTAKVNTKADLSYFGKPEIKDISSSLGGSISAWDEEEED